MTGRGWLEFGKGGDEISSGRGEVVGWTSGKCRMGVDGILTGNSLK